MPKEQRPEINFLDAMQAVYGQLAIAIRADGTIHRFHVPGDNPGSKNGWYVLYLDGIASGCFGSWKSGTSQTWSSRQPVDGLERALVSQRIEEALRQREFEQAQRQWGTAKKAFSLWNNARRADPNHPYLIAKGCHPYSLRQRNGELLVPLYLDGVLVNLQRIGADGQKRFLPGGRVKGCYSPLGSIKPGEPLYLCEGWATGATLHAEGRAAVACAMNAGNLLEAGRHLRRRYPDAVLIVAGDDDRLTTGNPGRTSAIKAAAALDCGLILPPWQGIEPLSLSDFNDLNQWRMAK